MMNTISPLKFDAIVNEVVEVLPKRTKTILVRRFGLKNGKRETLEAIGGSYDITRERVRQIENDALKQLSKPELLAKMEPAFSYLADHFQEFGNVRAEERILDHVAGETHPHPKRQAILFALTVGSAFNREAESDDYHAHWTTNDTAKKEMKDMLMDLIRELEASGNRTWKEEDILAVVKAKRALEEQAARSYLEVSKKISRNVFGEYGLSRWPEISPSGVRDKAYLVMRREGKPLHFSEITDRINQAFGSRRAYVQTVHNELIKDKRFVLVGRGLYALSDWGYSPGTVRDVLMEILKEKGPMNRESILEETLRRRVVRPNTIVLNLQNPKFFVKLDDGRYVSAAA